MRTVSSRNACWRPMSAPRTFLAEHKQTCLYRIHASAVRRQAEEPARLSSASSAWRSAAATIRRAKDYAAAARKSQAASGFPVAADGDAAFAEAGDVQPGQRRPLRPGLRALHPLHLADSPLSDLLVHRAIKAVLAGEKYVPESASGTISACSARATERRADEATRDVENWLKCFFMKERIGEEFDGTISAVTGIRHFRCARHRSISKVWSMSQNWVRITSSSTTSSTRCSVNGPVSVSAWVTGCGSSWCGRIWNRIKHRFHLGQRRDDFG
jgi:hypothetical protein